MRHLTPGGLHHSTAVKRNRRNEFRIDRTLTVAVFAQNGSGVLPCRRHLRKG